MILVQLVGAEAVMADSNNRLCTPSYVVRHWHKQDVTERVCFSPTGERPSISLVSNISYQSGNHACATEALHRHSFICTMHINERLCGSLWHMSTFSIAHGNLGSVVAVLDTWDPILTSEIPGKC